MRSLAAVIFWVAVLSAFGTLASAQITDEAARELVRSAVRSELPHDFFIGVQRDEKLEESLALAVGSRAGSEFIYKVSPEGVEIKGDAVIYHSISDGEFIFVIAVNREDGSTYRIRGFDDSLKEFQKLMTATGARISTPYEAKSLADFYREVSPEKFPMTPVSSLLDLKQGAERQCQGGMTSFDHDQKAFNAWWKHARSLYAKISFEQTATPRSGGYLVEWIILSSPAPENCGGAPLRVRLEVSSDGHIGKVTFSPLPGN